MNLKESGLKKSLVLESTASIIIGVLAIIVAVYNFIFQKDTKTGMIALVPGLAFFAIGIYMKRNASKKAKKISKIDFP